MLSTNNPSNKKSPQSSSADDEHITSRSHREDAIANLSTTLDKLNEFRTEQKFGQTRGRGNGLDQTSLQENSKKNYERADKAAASNQSHGAITNLSGTLKNLKKMRIRQEIERSRSQRNDLHRVQLPQELRNCGQRSNTHSVHGDDGPNRQTRMEITFETRPQSHGSDVLKYENTHAKAFSTEATRSIQVLNSVNSNGRKTNGTSGVQGDDNYQILDGDRSAVSTVEKKRIISIYDRTMKETENIFEPIVPQPNNDNEELEIVLALDDIIGENSLSVERETASEDNGRMSIEPPDRHSLSSVNGILNLSVSDKNQSSANSSTSKEKSGSRSKSFWKRSSSTGTSSRAREDSKAKTKSENKSQGVRSDSDSGTNSLRSSIESLKKKVKKTVKSTMCIALPSAKLDDIRPPRRDVKVSRPMNVNVAQTPAEARSKARSYFDMAKHFANELGDFENGCYMFEKAIKERKRFSIANTESYADQLFEYVKLLKKMGNYAKAEHIWNQSTEIKRMINST